MKKFYSFSTILLIAALLIPAAIPAYEVRAQGELVGPVEIQQDGTIMKDAQIVQESPTTNSGSSTQFGVGEDNTNTTHSSALLEFDLSGLPADATVESATLSIWVETDRSSNARTMRAYAINNDWVETQVTWNNRKSSTPWQTAGANGASDVIADDIGSTAMADNLTDGTRVDVVLDPAMVTEMIRQNYLGIKLKMDTEADDRYLFKSSDHGTAAQRPMLTVSYYPDTPIVDPGWFCAEGAIGIHTYNDCEPLDPEIAVSPFLISGFDGNMDDFGSPGLGEPIHAALMNCTPKPRCKNDFPVHYRIEYSITWTAAGSTTATINSAFNIPGTSDIELENRPCGTGTSGNCTGIWTGILTEEEMGETSHSQFDIGVHIGAFFPATWPATADVNYTIFLSREPFDQDCADTYMVPAPYTYTIDPTIETPVGPVTDYQIFDTVVDSLYMVRVENGPWDDGTDPRTDAAVSLDGTTWMSWEEFSVTASCIDTDPTNPDFDVLYFVASGTEFHIRANDTAGNFADNSNDAETPFQYVIGLALPIDEGECGSQFTFDDVEDLIATVNVDSTDGDVPVLDDGDPPSSEILQVGEWYAIEVVSGAWTEPGQEPSIAMEYVVGSSFGATWEDLAEGSSLVECVVDTERNIVFIQADDTQLHLRADDQDLNFANNTGTLNVNVYHAAFERRSETCELSFALDDLVRSDSVNATQDNGKVFAFSVGSALTNQAAQTENFLSYGLVPGAWYALETTGGPWRFGSSPNNVVLGESWQLEVAEEAAASTGTTPESSWGPLSEWEMATCNIEIDQLGHRLVYFQIPVTAAHQWKLRVEDLIGWPFKSGSMSWNLYRVIDLGTEYNGACDYTYSVEDLVNEAPYTVNATAVNGAPLVFEPNTYYAVEILGNDYQWYEEDMGDPHTDMEISLNNGQIWGDLPGAGALCSVTDGDNLIFFIHTGAEAPYFKLRVNSESFGDNVGMMGWNVYTAEAGTSVNPWDDCVATGYSIVAFGPIEWIPVLDEQGRMITSTSAAYAEIGGLVPGNRYIVETSRGPWYDSAEQTIEHEHFTAQVSSDDGLTWQEMDGTNPDVSCWESSQDFKYRKIEFIVEAGQVWKIRVNDEGNDFTDNTGNLAYTLKGEVLPDDTAVQGHITIPGCNSPALVPAPMEADDLLNVGNYLAGWVDFATASVMGFLAWCPEHTETLSLFGSNIETKDPFATLDEMDALLNDIKNELNGYDWNDDVEDYSLLTKSPSESAAMIDQYIFGPLPDDSPWLGNDLVNFDEAPEPTAYYESCQLALKEWTGALLGEGVCFASNWAREVGMSFWMQLMLDVSIVFGCIAAIFNDIRRLLYLFTGVNLSIQSGDAKVFVNYIQDDNNNSSRRGRR
jgi:hypothetical protein